MTPDKKRSVAFTGYRPDKIVLSDRDPNVFENIRGGLRVVLRDLYERGYRRYLSGMAEGFDLIAAEEVLKLQSGECPEMELVAVIPFKSQPNRFTAENKLLYENVLKKASDKVLLSEVYYRGCYEFRNDYLVDNSSIVVSYFDGRQGGTKYTISQAKRRGIPVINIYDKQPTLF